MIHEFSYSFGPRASSAAKEVITILHPVTDNLRAASGADGSKESNRALKTIKGIRFISHDNFEGFLVGITAFVTSFHGCSLDESKLAPISFIVKVPLLQY